MSLNMYTYTVCSGIYLQFISVFIHTNPRHSYKNFINKTIVEIKNYYTINIIKLICRDPLKT